MIRLIGVLLLFGITIYITNHFEASIVGQYDLIRNYILVLSSICIVGTDQSIMYFNGKLNNDKALLFDVYKKIIKLIAFVFSIIIVVVPFSIHFFVTNFLHDEVFISKMYLATFLLFFITISLLNTEILRVLNLVILSEFSRNILKYIPLLVGVVLILEMNYSSYLTDVFLYGFILVFIISTLLVLKSFKMGNLAIVKSDISIKEIFNKSFPMSISGICLFLLLSIDLFLLKKYFGNSLVAYYSVGIKLITILSIFILSININSASKIAELFNKNNKLELQKIVTFNARLILFFTLPISLFLLIFRNQILSIFGNDYQSASIPFIILLIGQLLGSAFSTSAIYMNMTGKEKVYRNILLLSVSLNLILNLILIPTFEMIGAAISFAICNIFYNIVASIYIFRKDKIKVVFS